MSSQESIAAQFWLWPDPVMKRDAQGRILFINAAFLQLYGGTVEAWTGNILQGWPAPQPTEPGAYPVPYRFETRMPSQDPSGPEEIYDWIEQSAPDGTAFALARNVSPFVSTSVSHDAPPTQMAQEQQKTQEQVTASAASQPQQASQPQSYEERPQSSPSDYEPSENAAPPASDENYQSAAPSADSQEYTPLSMPGASHDGSTPDEGSAYHESSAADSAPAPEAAPQAPSLEQQEFQAVAEMASDDDYSAQESGSQTYQGTETARPEAAQSEQRDFERRALPLDENSAVLGNNWRDAVIAKALGVEEEKSATQDAAPSADGHQNNAAHQQSPARNNTGSDGPEKRILLAEDNAINALLTRTLLEAEGHFVETVEDGVLAVEAMKSQSYDLIFMDMRMPNMDGLEATRKIRALPNVTKDLPIIALTANAFDDDRNACFDSGMNDFMTKPVSAEELTQMVRTWTGDQAKKDAA